MFLTFGLPGDPRTGPFNVGSANTIQEGASIGMQVGFQLADSLHMTHGAAQLTFIDTTNGMNCGTHIIHV